MTQLSREDVGGDARDDTTFPYWAASISGAPLISC